MRRFLPRSGRQAGAIPPTPALFSLVRPDDDVCLCFRVSLRKIRGYLAREDPPVASLISECLSAGTGCGWCVPFLRSLHAQHRRGDTPDLPFESDAYAQGRVVYRATGERPADADPPAAPPPPDPA